MILTECPKHWKEFFVGYYYDTWDNKNTIIYYFEQARCLVFNRTYDSYTVIDLDSAFKMVEKDLKIRKLLLHCLEEHYGSLEIVATDWAQQVLKEIDEKIQMVRKVLYS